MGLNKTDIFNYAQTMHQHKTDQMTHLIRNFYGYPKCLEFQKGSEKKLGICLRIRNVHVKTLTLNIKKKRVIFESRNDWLKNGI